MKAYDYAYVITLTGHEISVVADIVTQYVDALMRNGIVLKIQDVNALGRALAKMKAAHKKKIALVEEKP